MNRAEIKAEIARTIREVPVRDGLALAETILVFLEDIGFDWESSYAERTGTLAAFLKRAAV
jgi:hypothetical protein